ncbi:MAG: four helix bundle protein [Chloroflexi bacterium]|nr:four helix bundle protein [Chloroflexota bacterium]
MEKELKAFRKLIVWQRAHELTLMIYKTSEKFPKHEVFGLTSQMRRAVVSVEANIAEGYALGTAPNYLRHLNISVGSLAETESHVEIAHDLQYLTDTNYEKLTDKAREIGYLLSRLKESIERNTHKKP